MDSVTAAIKIQSVWRMWIVRRRYAETETESEYEWDEAEACFERAYHNFHCGGY